MALKKRGAVWWIDVVSPSGERIRRTTGTAVKALAQELHDQVKVELWRIDKLGAKPPRTWNEAAVRWLKENQHKATASEDVAKLRWLDRYLRDRELSAIDRSLIDRVTAEKLAQGLSNATVNRTLELLRAVLRKCVNEWEWLDRAPYIRLLKEPTRRIRYLAPEEARRLLNQLPPHMADMAAFSLATGLRASNVTGLEWSQVDEERKLAWIHPDQAKARKAIAVPLNRPALEIVHRRQGMHPTHVFSFRGGPITQVSTKAWYGALKRAGIEDFRWHDLRHTWASWHVQSGTPLFALQELGGWESTEMVRRYAHLAADHLAPYAERLGTLAVTHVANHGTFMAQLENQGS
jgi:integrase